MVRRVHFSAHFASDQNSEPHESSGSKHPQVSFHEEDIEVAVTNKIPYLVRVMVLPERIFLMLDSM